MTYRRFFKNSLALIEKGLRDLLRAQRTPPLSIHRAMEYAVFSGAKRFRPVLALSACEACGGDPRRALPAALAIELIHTYSLVHDDLPALDNDALRRGKPTCHKKFGEANAILAGDALLTLAFELLAKIKPAERAVRLLREISTAAGTHGMIGGQVADLEIPACKKTVALHRFISERKTGALIRVSAAAGAIAAGATTRQFRSIVRYGEYLGHAFQVVDDILDRDGYCEAMSVPAAIKKAEHLIGQAKKELRIFSRNAQPLFFLADFLKARIPLRTLSTS